MTLSEILVRIVFGPGVTALPRDQVVRERAFKAGRAAHAGGRSRTSSGEHGIPRAKRTRSDDVAIDAFELGWATAARCTPVHTNDQR